MPIANRSTTARAKPTGCGRPSGDGAYAHGSNVAGPRADGGEQESLLAERRGFGNSRAEKRADLTWLGKATGRGSVNATISMCMDFLVGTAHLSRSSVGIDLCSNFNGVAFCVTHHRFVVSVASYPRTSSYGHSGCAHGSY